MKSESQAGLRAALGRSFSRTTTNMCTLLLWKRQHPRYPLIAAANRDEYFDRESTGPTTLHAEPLVVGGRDEVGGGSWLAVNAGGFVVALTNRRDAGKHDPTRRSRGLVVLEAARSKSFQEALANSTRLDARAFNPFFLLIADADRAAVVRAEGGAWRVDRIEEGAHAITNWELDAASPPAAARALRAARGSHFQPHEDAQAIARRLHEMLADHGEPDGSELGLCVHRAASSYGTRSSTIVFLGHSLSDMQLFDAQGPPCAAPLVDMSAVLRHETSPRSANNAIS